MPHQASRNASLCLVGRRGQRFLRHSSALALVLGASLVGTKSAYAGCSPNFPGNGSTVTCTTNFPNPDLTGISALPGANNITVIMQQGAQIQVATTAISLNGGDQITNNSGAIISGGIIGVEDTGPVTITNAGQISGNLHAGVELEGSGVSTFTNTGSINSNNGDAVELETVAGSQMTLNNQSGGSINANVTGEGPGSITIMNAGNFNGGININGTGINSLTTTTNINGRVSMTGAQNTVVNGAALNSGLTLVGTTSNTVTNQANAFINQTFTVSGATNVVTNSGTLNAGITVSGNGTNTITNAAGGTIDSVFSVAGRPVNTIVNAGTINTTMNVSGSGSVRDSGTISGGGTAIRFNASPGPFTLTLEPTYVINGKVLGTGDDTFQLGGAGAGTFNVSNIGPLQQYQGFAIFNKIETSTWTLTGTGTQDWTIQAGTLVGDTNSLGGDLITNNSALVFNQSFTGTYAGIVAGSGTTTIAGSGVVIFTGNNTYTGGTTINSGSALQLGNGGSSGSVIGVVNDNGRLVFNRADTYIFNNEIRGTGAVRQNGPGAVVLQGNSGSFTGSTGVNGGTLIVNGTLGAPSSTVAVNAGTLTGTGTIGGAVTVNSGGTLAGSQGAALSMGSLTLNSGSNINVALGSPNTTVPAFNVNGALTLAGTMNVSDLGGFGTGVYRIFNYSGALTDNGVSFGTLPSGVTASNLSLQTSAPNVVDLAVDLTPAPTPRFVFWDGANGHDNGTIDGGSGIWNAANSNWTTISGTPNGAWTTHFAIFEGTPGTVTVDNSAGAISATGMQFVVSGYHLTGDVLTLQGTAPRIRVGDGTTAGASYTATIDNVLAGTGTLTKTDLGTLILTGANTYQDGTSILAGTISISSDANLGAASGSVSFLDGVLQTTANIGTGRLVNIATSASFATAANTTLELDSTISGSGSLAESGAGTLILTRDETYLAGTDINSGTVQLGNGGTSGSVVGGITDNGALTIDRSGSFTYDGAVSGTGGLRLIGSGATVLTAQSSYSGPTVVANGTLVVHGGLTGTSSVSVGDGGAAALVVEQGGQIESGTGAIGNLAGTTGTVTVTDANSVWNNAGTLTIGGAGNGTLIISDQGSVNAGNVVIAAQAGSTGLLVVGSPQGLAPDLSVGTLDPPSITFGAGSGTILVNQSGTTHTFDAMLSGSGAVQLVGPGITILTGDSSAFTGTTTVNAGTLVVSGTLGNASSVLTVNNGGTVTGTGTVGGTFTIGSGGTLSGIQGTTLTTGPLTLSSGSNINVALGAPSSTGLFNVNGALTLAGTLNITDLGGFGPGTYRLIDYSGALTDNGVVFGTLPSGVAPSTLSVQTAVPQQVNLVDSGSGGGGGGGVRLQFWDGPNTTANSAINGGTGTWNAVNTNWTNTTGTVNGSWQTDFAIFTGAPGTVTVDNSAGAISATGMQFAVDGYTLNGGTLTLTGSVPIIRVGDGTAAGANYTATIDNVLAGTGELVKTDLGTLVLAGANTYTGGTLIAAGTISISSDANLGQSGTALTFLNGTLETTSNIVTGRAVGTLQSATFQTDAGTTLELDGAITGAGLLAKTGSGTLIIAGQATETGGTVISSGTLQLGTGGASGSLAGDLTDNGSFVVDRSDVYTFSGAISGTGSFTQAGAGTTILTGDSDYAGGTTISAGTLQVGNGGTSGAIIGNIVDNGVLVADRSDSFVFPGSVSGTGAVVQEGTGTIVVTGNNTFTGGLTISAGTIVIGSGNTSGSIVGNVVDNATLAFDRQDVVTFPGQISGNGVLEQIGAGSTTLTGDSSAFSGSTAVNAGMLVVNGRLGNAASTLAVNNGGTLAGTGTIGGSATINSGGTLSPAGTGSLGTLTVNGNLTFAPGSIYSVDLAPAASDLVVVGGQARPGGEVEVTVAPGNYPANAKYPIISAAGGVSGTFAGIDPPSGSIFFEPALSYDANHVYIVLTDSAFTSVAQTPNQMATAGALATLPITSPLYDAIFNLGSAEEARRAFNALSGEIYASTAGAMIEESRYVREAVLARLRGAYDVSPPANSPDPPASGPWFQYIGAFGSFDSNGNAADLDTSSIGAIAGYDVAVLDNWRVGAAGAFIHSDLELNARASIAAFDSADVALYGAGNFDPFVLRAGAVYAWQNVTVRRAVDFTNFADMDGAHYRAPEVQAFGEVGYDLSLAPVMIEPFANVAYVHLDTHGFAESGGAAALLGTDKSQHTIFTTAGAHASSALGDVGGAPVSLFGTLGWQHAFSDTTPIATLAFAEGGLPFTVAGVPLARNSGFVESGFDVLLENVVNVGFSYTGQIAGSARDNAVRATIDWNF